MIGGVLLMATDEQVRTDAAGVINPHGDFSRTLAAEPAGATIQEPAASRPGHPELPRMHERMWIAEIMKVCTCVWRS